MLWNCLTVNLILHKSRFLFLVVFIFFISHMKYYRIIKLPFSEINTIVINCKISILQPTNKEKSSTHTFITEYSDINIEILKIL